MDQTVTDRAGELQPADDDKAARWLEWAFAALEAASPDTPF